MLTEKAEQISVEIHRGISGETPEGNLVCIPAGIYGGIPAWSLIAIKKDSLEKFMQDFSWILEEIHWHIPVQVFNLAPRAISKHISEPQEKIPK